MDPCNGRGIAGSPHSSCLDEQGEETPLMLPLITPLDREIALVPVPVSDPHGWQVGYDGVRLSSEMS